MLNDFVVRYAGFAPRAKTAARSLAISNVMQTAPQASLRLGRTEHRPLVDANAAASLGALPCSAWEGPTVPPLLRLGEVHVWRVDLSDIGIVDKALKMLSEAERDR